MPELAEVEYYRKQWDTGVGERIRAVAVHPDKRIFRECNAAQLVTELEGRSLCGSLTHGKQMLFEFSDGAWLRLRLGMTGNLSAANKDYEPSKHDHLVFECDSVALIFNDSRQFGSCRLHVGKELPSWWSSLPPQILDPRFTLEHCREALRRRSRSPLKSILLDQSWFPGIGNWMADEILWRTALHPALLGGSIRGSALKSLFNKTIEVARDALEVIGTDWGTPPTSWLFPHRWNDGGICPSTGEPLVRETIGGRTTCYCPTLQTLP